MKHIIIDPSNKAVQVTVRTTAKGANIKVEKQGTKVFQHRIKLKPEHDKDYRICQYLEDQWLVSGNCLDVLAEKLNVDTDLED